MKSLKKPRGECQGCHLKQDVINGVITTHRSLLGVAIGVSVCPGTGKAPKFRGSLYAKEKV